MMQRWEQGESIPNTYIRLRSLIALREGRTGITNPAWVEWLMGFPPEWTVSALSAMPSSRKSRKSSAGGSSK